MQLDIRLPIGLMFTLLGALLAVFGLISDSSSFRNSLGINVNLWWGLVMLLFGGLMLAFAARAKNTTSAAPHTPSARPRSH